MPSAGTDCKGKSWLWQLRADSLALCENQVRKRVRISILEIDHQVDLSVPPAFQVRSRRCGLLDLLQDFWQVLRVVVQP